MTCRWEAKAPYILSVTSKEFSVNVFKYKKSKIIYLILHEFYDTIIP